MRTSPQINIVLEGTAIGSASQLRSLLGGFNVWPMHTPGANRDNRKIEELVERKIEDINLFLSEVRRQLRVLKKLEKQNVKRYKEAAPKRAAMRKKASQKV